MKLSHSAMLIPAFVAVLFTSSPTPAQNTEASPAAPSGPAAKGALRPSDLDKGPAPTGSRVPVRNRSEPIERDVARQMHLEMAKCVYARGVEKVEALLKHSDQMEIDYEGWGYAKADLNKELNLESCLGKTMPDNFASVRLGFRQSMLRAGLAEVSYLSRQRRPLQKADLWTETIADRLVVPSAASAAARIQGDFADCIIFHNPAAADAVLRANVASESEKDAVKSLVPTLSKCVNEGSELELTVPTIRRFVANGLWARSHYQGRAPSTLIGGAQPN